MGSNKDLEQWASSRASNRANKTPNNRLEQTRWNKTSNKASNKGALSTPTIDRGAPPSSARSGSCLSGSQASITQTSITSRDLDIDLLSTIAYSFRGCAIDRACSHPER
jgi:hypothetical protein